MDFDVTTLLAAAKRIPAQQKLITRLLVGDKIRMIDGNKADIDHYMGTRKLAPVVARVIGGKLVGHTAWTNYEFDTPLVAPRWDLTEDFLQHRMPGEPVVGGMSMSEREDAWIGMKIAEGRGMVDRFIEWQSATLLSTGAMTIQGDGYLDVIDLGHNNNEVLAGAALWTEATGDPLTDLERWISQCQSESGVTPNICVMGTTAAGAFLANDNVQAALDTRNYNIGRIEPRSMPEGGRFLGYISALDLEVYSYGAQYETDGGVMTPYLAADRIVLFPDASRNSAQLCYSPLRDARNKTWYQVEVYPRGIVDENANTEYLEVASKPLVVFVEVESWFWADVL